MDADFWRAFIFAQAFIVGSLTVTIVIRYSIMLALKPIAERALPTHIVLISSSYLVAIIYICLSLRERLGLPLTYRAPLAGLVFILGDGGLVFMLIHIIMQRRFIDEVRDHVAEKQSKETVDLGEAVKHEASGLAQMIKVVGEKADSAYEAANGINEKILELKDHRNKITQIDKNVAETKEVVVQRILPVIEGSPPQNKTLAP